MAYTGRTFKCPHSSCKFKSRKMCDLATHYRKYPSHHPRGGKSVKQVTLERRRRRKKQKADRDRARTKYHNVLPVRKKAFGKTAVRKLVRFCTGCGFRIKSTWTFCGHCGMKLERSST
jgi:hypothetical protein